MKVWEEFVSKYPTRKFKKGSIILHQGDVPSAVYVIKSGFINNYEISSDGVEKPILFDRHLEVFPIGWVFDLITRCQFFYEAFTDVVLWVVPKEDVNQFFLANPKSQYAFFRDFVERMLDLQTRFVALQQNKASDKILLTIHFLASRFGDRLKGDRVFVYLPLTQQDMANFLGLTRETTSIELKQLQNDGVIKYDRQKYYVNMPKLQDKIDCL